jgi:RNA-directed DNA polymerase
MDGARQRVALMHQAWQPLLPSPDATEPAKLDTATSAGLIATNSDDASTGDLGTDGRVVDPLASARVLERWESVVSRQGQVPTRRQAEHRAVVELLPLAFATLSTVPTSDREILTICRRLLSYERTITPAVGRYLNGRKDEGPVLDAFDELLRRRAYVNGWQTWWLQHAITHLPGFGTVGHGAKKRLCWARNALDTAEHAPILRAHAAMTLARHRHIQCDELLSIYARSSTTVRPVLAAAIALLAPSANIARAVKDDSTLPKWIYNHTKSDA